MLTLAVTCALGAAPAGAQWRVDVQAGRLSYEGVAGGSTTTMAFGASRTGARSLFALTAGIPLSREEPVWAALYGYRRLDVAFSRAWNAGVDLSADAFAYRIEQPDTFVRTIPLPGAPTLDQPDAITGWGGAAEVMPFVAWSGTRAGAELRAGGVGLVSSASEGAGFDRTAFMSDALVRVQALPQLELRADSRVVSAQEGTFPYVGAGATWTRGVTAWAALGRWLDGDVESLSWNVGASIPLGRRVAFIVSGSHDPFDPVYATPPRTSWGLGFSLWLGSGAVIEEPVPARYEDGVATIVIEDDGIDGTPSVAGDFNQWAPEPMTRDGDTWVFRVPLEPGVYNYAFVDGDGDWFVPVDTPGRRDDGMGGYVAVLVVE